MPDTAQALLDRWERLANRLVFLEKRYVFAFGDLRLHPSELHVLLAIRREPRANATRLGVLLGVTKGAVSQVLKRLEGKGVIVKQVDSAQKNEVTASFTPLGREAVAAFVAERATAREGLEAYVNALPPAERQALGRFLEQVAVALPGAE